MKPNQKDKISKVAEERIRALFKEAESSKDRKLCDRYVKIARKISLKTKTKLPKELKKRICKHCEKYLVPGENCRIRLSKGKMVYYCLNCRHFMRFPYK